MDEQDDCTIKVLLWPFETIYPFGRDIPSEVPTAQFGQVLDLQRVSDQSKLPWEAHYPRVW